MYVFFADDQYIGKSISRDLFVYLGLISSENGKTKENRELRHDISLRISRGCE